MSSNRRKRSSQANGARSRGPRTPEGKARSSQNAMRHGLLSNCVVLENESKENFRLLVSQYLERFGPVDPVEFGMIEELTAFYWRIRRAWAIETSMLDESIRHQSGPDEATRIAHAFRELSESHDLELVHRYETALQRMYQRALRSLLLLRAAPSPSRPDSNFVDLPPAAPPEKPAQTELPNEPNPISEHPPAPTAPPPAPGLRKQPSPTFGHLPAPKPPESITQRELDLLRHPFPPGTGYGRL